MTAAFHAEHRKLYGYDFAGATDQFVEWVNLRVSGIGPITRPETRRIDSATGAAPLDERARTGTRQVCFDATIGFVETPVLWRENLLDGDAFVGPAIIEEFGSTVPLHPGFAARIDSAGNIIITRSTSWEASK